MTDSKVVLIFSGDAESTTLFYQLINLRCEVIPLTFSYGQKCRVANKKEIKFAEQICNKFKVIHYVIDIETIAISRNNLSYLLNQNVDISLKIANQAEKPIYKSNMVPLSLTFDFANNMEANYIALANHINSCQHISPEFMALITALMQIESQEKIGIYNPYKNLQLIDVLKKGVKMGIDYDKNTWNCLENGEVPCGKCPKCLEYNDAKTMIEDIQNI